MRLKETSIKRNFVYKSILTVSGYLVAFIIFPYVSRILGVSNVGLVNFVDNTVQYFLLFASMGINVLGVREIARVKDNLQERNKVFSNLIGVNLLFTLLTLAAYFIIVSFSPQLSQYKELFYTGSAKILFTAFLIEWFYTGLEDFRYITIRSVAVKLLYVLSIFLLVRGPQDYKIYFYLTVAMTVVNAVINLLHARGYVKVDFKEIFNFRYIRKNVTLGIYSVMTSMYLTFNVMYLGLVTDNVQVGYYTTAYKLYTVVLGFFSAFTSVMLPRMSALVSEEQTDRFKRLVSKSFSAMSMFSMPLILCSLVMAPQIVAVLAGPGYEGAVLPMRIIMPAVLFVGVAQVLALQILMPLQKERVLLAASVTGAVVAVIVNMLSVKALQGVGSAIVLLCSEFVVTMVYVIYIYRNKIVALPWGEVLKNLLVSLPSVAVAFICAIYLENVYISLGVGVVAAVLVWAVMMAAFRRETLMDVIGRRR